MTRPTPHTCIHQNAPRHSNEFVLLNSQRAQNGKQVNIDSGHALEICLREKGVFIGRKPAVGNGCCMRERANMSVSRILVTGAAAWASLTLPAITFALWVLKLVKNVGVSGLRCNAQAAAQNAVAALQLQPHMHVFRIKQGWPCDGALRKLQLVNAHKFRPRYAAARPTGAATRPTDAVDAALQSGAWYPCHTWGNSAPLAIARADT